MGKYANECIVRVGERDYKIVENTDNGGIKVYSLDGKGLLGSTKVFWWDYDGITNLIKQNILQIDARLGLIQEVA